MGDRVLTAVDPSDTCRKTAGAVETGPYDTMSVDARTNQILRAKAVGVCSVSDPRRFDESGPPA